MTFKKWLSVLILQIFGILWAIWVFSSPIPKHIAGLTAGGVFLLVGLVPVLLLLRNPHRGRWVIFWSAIIFLICSALPIFGLRLIYWGQEFNTIVVGSLHASKLHGWSQSFYLAMIISHLWDGLAVFLLKHKK